MKEWVRIKVKIPTVFWIMQAFIALFFCIILCVGTVPSKSLAVACLFVAVYESLNLLWLFGYYRGIRFTSEKITFFSSMGIKSFRYEEIKQINVTFTRVKERKVRYTAMAEVIPVEGKVRTYMWRDTSGYKGGKITHDVTDKNIGQMIQTLEKYEKISVSVIGDE